MELLDMVPADAIALRLYSLPAAATAAASLWAWLVAALAATFGLWRFRTAGAAVRSALVDGDDDKQKTKQPPPRSSALPLSPAPASDDEARRVATPTPTSPMSEPSTPSKVRFTAYYGGGPGDDNDDGVVDSVRRRADMDTDEDDGSCSGARVAGEGETAPLRRMASGTRGRTTAAATLMATPWEEREMAVRRKGDLGWYRHLDMAALDGSVVRLWDGEVTAAASPRRRGRRALSELYLSL